MTTWTGITSHVAYKEEQVDEKKQDPPGTVVGEIRIVAEAAVIRDGKIVPPEEETDQ